MKTAPMLHQIEAGRRLAANPEYYALACEQGTGKTWMLLDDIERQYNAGNITGALVLAPKGVHSNWVRREVPTHLSVDAAATYWLASMGKKARRAFDRVAFEEEPERLVILAMNIDAISTKRGFDVARRFLNSRPCMMIVDESRRIKDPSTQRTKKAISLSDFTVSRRIASGTIIANGPLDAFGQYQFLRNGLLGTTSYRAFVAEYAEVLPPTNRLVQKAAERSRPGMPPPQIIARDGEGRPRFRNLEKLRNVIEPYTYRVMKRDCLDIPEKIYQTRHFELTPPMRKVYEGLLDDMRHEWPDGEIDNFNALTLVGKLRQAARGFLYRDGDAQPFVDPLSNPALKLLEETLEDVDGQFIVWASRRVEIQWICDLLKRCGISFVEYHGGVKDAAREEAIDAFQAGTVRAFVGTPAAGGTGLTLTAAETAIYYSDDFDLEAREQSEDRNHRQGTKGDCVYIDLCATGTIDERIAASHQSKKGTAAAILNFSSQNPFLLEEKGR